MTVVVQPVVAPALHSHTVDGQCRTKSIQQILQPSPTPRCGSPSPASASMRQLCFLTQVAIRAESQASIALFQCVAYVVSISGVDVCFDNSHLASNDHPSLPHFSYKLRSLYQFCKRLIIFTAPPANSNDICCKIKFMNFLRNLCFEAKRNHLTQVSF